MDEHNINQPAPDEELPDASADVQDAQQRRLIARRRLLKGGLGLAPVSMTMVSRPVLAGGTDTCHGPTGFQSAPPSRLGTTPSCTIGKCDGPDKWKPCVKSAYPGSCGDKTFATCFQDSTKFSKLTIYNAINGLWGSSYNGGTSYSSASDNDKAMARKAAAAYLNSLKTGNGFPMSTTQVQKFWQGYVANNYRPGGTGVTWNTYSQYQNYVGYVMTS